MGNYYPRGATLGGSSQVNAMNFVWAPDNEWDYIAELTGDKSWEHQHMRRHLMDLENCTYVPRGTPGHGFDGYIEVSLSLIATASECKGITRISEDRDCSIANRSVNSRAWETRRAA
jgi:choline dehydrogenase-like flavoprotein